MPLVYLEWADLLADADRDLMGAVLRRRRPGTNLAISLGGARVRDFGRGAALATFSTSRLGQGAVLRKGPLIGGHRRSTPPRDFGQTLGSHRSEAAPAPWFDCGRLTGRRGRPGVGWLPGASGRTGIVIVIVGRL